MLHLLLILLETAEACVILGLLMSVLDWIHLDIVQRIIIFLSLGRQLVLLHWVLLSIVLISTPLISRSKPVTCRLKILSYIITSSIYLWLSILMVFLIILESYWWGSGLGNCWLPILRVLLRIIAIYWDIICILLLWLLLGMI